MRLRVHAAIIVPPSSLKLSYAQTHAPGLLKNFIETKQHLLFNHYDTSMEFWSNFYGCMSFLPKTSDSSTSVYLIANNSWCKEHHPFTSAPQCQELPKQNRISIRVSTELSTTNISALIMAEMAKYFTENKQHLHVHCFCNHHGKTLVKCKWQNLNFCQPKNIKTWLTDIDYFIPKFPRLELKLLTEWNVSSWSRHHNKMVWSAIAWLVRLVKSAL